MKKLNPKHQIFIREMILHGNRIKAYTAAYPDVKATSAAARACTLMKNPLIHKSLEKANNRIIDKSGKIAADVLQAKLRTINGMRELLSAVLSGEFCDEKPEISDILMALSINLRMMKAFTGKDLPPIVEIIVPAPEKRLTPEKK